MRGTEKVEVDIELVEQTSHGTWAVTWTTATHEERPHGRVVVGFGPAVVTEVEVALGRTGADHWARFVGPVDFDPADYAVEAVLDAAIDAAVDAAYRDAESAREDWYSDRRRAS